MSWVETFRTGFEAVRSHRLRSALTMLGILIGIAAVILTVGLGKGASAQVRSQISALGTNLLVITPGSSTSSSGVRGGFGSGSSLKSSDAEALGSKSAAPDIAGVAPTITSSQELTAGTTNWTSSVVGTSADWLTVRARDIDEGRFLTADDESKVSAVVVLGSETAAELFTTVDPLGQVVTVNGVPLEVIGVLSPSGNSSGTSNDDDTAIVPLSTASERLFGGTTRTTVNTIYVAATSSSTLSAAYQEASQILLASHNITDATSPDFTITSQQSLLSTATSVNKTLTILLAGIAAISLLVGGIGVMNIMLVSVTERIREIGLRKALGATPRVIRRQFLVEASVLGLAGGVLGVAIGVGGAYVIPAVSSSEITLSPVATVGSIAVALVIGLVFGVYPAGRAARLAPIDALRSE